MHGRQSRHALCTPRARDHEVNGGTLLSKVEGQRCELRGGAPLDEQDLPGSRTADQRWAWGGQPRPAGAGATAGRAL